MTGCVILKKKPKKTFFIFTIFTTKSEQKLCSVDVFRLCKIREILGFHDCISLGLWHTLLTWFPWQHAACRQSQYL